LSFDIQSQNYIVVSLIEYRVESCVVCYLMYAGLSFEKDQYFVSEGDGFVEVCANLYGRPGLTVAVVFTASGYDAEGIFCCFKMQLHSW